MFNDIATKHEADLNCPRVAVCL